MKNVTQPFIHINANAANTAVTPDLVLSPAIGQLVNARAQGCFELMQQFKARPPGAT